MIVVGALVEARPFWSDRVRSAMTAVPGVEVHGIAPDGRLILTVDDGQGARPGRSLQQVKELEGVVSVTLIGDPLGQTSDTEREATVAGSQLNRGGGIGRIPIG